jgi:hypothetical protein
MTYRRLLFVFLLSVSAFPSLVHAQLSPNVTVWATGLNAPRGIKFGADGYLYVAEAGTGGSLSTAGACTQVVPPVGPYLGGQTGRISKIDPQANVSTVATGFASTVDSEGDLMGVADLAFLDDTLYALVAGGGCSHGNPTLPSGIYKVDQTAGTGTLFANLDSYLRRHPAEYENPADFEPDGSFYSMIVNNGKLLTVEPNHGQIFSTDAQGTIEEILDVSASQGHIVPTTLFAYKDNLYLGNLGLFPIDPTTARLMTISPFNCFVEPVAGLQDSNVALNIVHSKAGFTTMVGLTLGPDGLVYVLELSDAAGYPTPGAGDVVRISATGQIETVATGLTLPTAMTFGPDGKLYVSNFGAYNEAGSGQIVQVDVN